MEGPFTLNMVFQVRLTVKLVPEPALHGVWELAVKVSRRLAFLPGLR